MICKPIIIKSKRSRSSLQNTLHQNNTQQKYSKSDLNQKDWKNSLVTLNKILYNLNDDTVKKYNTQIDRYANLNIPTPVNNDTHRSKSSFANEKLQVRTSTKFQTFEPEPWFNDNEIRKCQKSSKTNHVLNSSHISLPKDWQQRNSLQKSVNNSSYRDRLNTEPEGDKSQKIQKMVELIEENQAFWTQNFAYTNEQKAKVSIQYLLHQQKHKKMEKILKYKRHLIDRPGLKKQKIQQHSKFLVDMLKKLSKDNLFTSTLSQSKGESKKINFLKTKTNSKKSSFQTIQQNDKEVTKKQMKSTSCCNLTIANQTETKTSKKRTKPTCSIKEISANFKEQFENKKIHSYKMSFKPRRNLIFEKIGSSNSERNLKQNEIMKSLRKLNEKQFAVTSHFLIIKKVKS